MGGPTTFFFFGMGRGSTSTVGGGSPHPRQVVREEKFAATPQGQAHTLRSPLRAHREPFLLPSDWRLADSRADSGAGSICEEWCAWMSDAARPRRNKTRADARSRLARRCQEASRESAILAVISAHQGYCGCAARTRARKDTKLGQKLHIYPGIGFG